MHSRIVVTALTLILSVALAPNPTTGQTRDAPTSPRTPWGHPNLQGIWTNVSVTPLERPREFAGRTQLTDEEIAALEGEVGGLRSFRQQTEEARDAGDPLDEQRLDRQGLNYNSFWYQQKTVSRQTSLIVDPPDGQIPPFTAEGERRAARGLETNQRVGIEAIGRRGYDNYDDRSLWERCLTRPLPRLPGPYNNNFLILQTPTHVVMLMEMIHEVRVIPIDGRPHVADAVRQWLGDSRGRWEGDSLVVETTNFSSKANFIGARAGLRLTERFTRIDDDTMIQEATLDDRTTWTHPWTVRIPMARSDGPPFEYACHEGNYGLYNILAGARAEEAASTTGR
jgi:hypothetical protein